MLVKGDVSPWFMERAKYIPIRLSLNERKLLRLLEAALTVSEYTDRIDILSYVNKGKRIVAQIKEFCSILSGLVLAADYKGLSVSSHICSKPSLLAGQDLFEDRAFEDNAEFYQKVFELGRRHKIMNPDKMRQTYGKLIYMLMDAQIPEIKDMLQFSCVTEIRTVYKVLSEGNGLALLQDELIVTATQEIIPTGKTRSQIQREIKLKERAIETLAHKYSSEDLPLDTVKLCLYSIGDNHAFLRTNRDPCEQMISYLKQYFHPENIEPGFSLSIQLGKEGARLSHSHEKQYHYVYQSLSLWREVLHEMFQLWYTAESDLLSETCPYRLRDTGQGLNRVQAAPGVSRIMHSILNRAQQKMGYWVGSSVIHLGDHNVPNAFMFIDKYSQIYRFLLPVATVLEKLGEIVKDPGIKEFIDNGFGGVEKARKTILCDFFRHAFDGSGADNYFDAGSCIDGRLTSAWNWCSNVEKKSYFPIFLLTGFIGFDGQF